MIHECLATLQPGQNYQRQLSVTNAALSCKRLKQMKTTLKSQIPDLRESNTPVGTSSGNHARAAGALRPHEYCHGPEGSQGPLNLHMVLHLFPVPSEQ